MNISTSMGMGGLRVRRVAGVSPWVPRMRRITCRRIAGRRRARRRVARVAGVAGYWRIAGRRVARRRRQGRHGAHLRGHRARHRARRPAREASEVEVALNGPLHELALLALVHLVLAVGGFDVQSAMQEEDTGLLQQSQSTLFCCEVDEAKVGFVSVDECNKAPLGEEVPELGLAISVRDASDEDLAGLHLVKEGVLVFVFLIFCIFLSRSREVHSQRPADAGKVLRVHDGAIRISSMSVGDEGVGRLLTIVLGPHDAQSRYVPILLEVGFYLFFLNLLRKSSGEHLQVMLHGSLLLGWHAGKKRDFPSASPAGVRIQKFQKFQEFPQIPEIQEAAGGKPGCTSPADAPCAREQSGKQGETRPAGSWRDRDQ
mmetsp:Transcript_1155/g.2465  ORF Transcript_1155/g.2465 Transcript_1155/m.2465 type:complete len:372 (+) Transcript_1155:589-1704(+)